MHVYLLGVIRPACPKDLLDQNDARKSAECANVTLRLIIMLSVCLYMMLRAVEVEVRTRTVGPFSFSLNCDDLLRLLGF